MLRTILDVVKSPTCKMLDKIPHVHTRGITKIVSRCKSLDLW
jgi:hypothetical protein